MNSLFKRRFRHSRRLCCVNSFKNKRNDSVKSNTVPWFNSNRTKPVSRTTSPKRPLKAANTRPLGLYREQIRLPSGLVRSLQYHKDSTRLLAVCLDGVALKNYFAYLLLHFTISELRARYFRTNRAEFDRPAYMNEPAVECGKCFPGCYQEGDNGEQINTCASECYCAKKRSVDVYFDEPFMDAKDPEVCKECFSPPQGCYQNGDKADQITTCLYECKCV